MTNPIKKRCHWKGKSFDFDVEESILPNGKRSTTGMVRHPGCSAIVPVQKDHSVILLRQYRPAVRGFIWEIPAGTMHQGEDSLACARRELQEETGYRGNRFEKIGEILPAPGYSNERIHLYLATELVPCKQSLDEDECLEIHSFRFEEVMEMITKGEIQDAMSIAGLHMASMKINQNSKNQIPMSE
jgi:ADP-ribose pyrophosphatase